ncbi:DUF4397 domain-containing protein [Pedobacter riviphilus]|uniref:DUF4397 domain-containing protein n=1 Tax=Pedobacter riviphilus TaxID=2766984 RepID=A0ABX6TJ93_9SPHI|nr:DUF4397 domain-containing protein [Pedobacter riviphilus]QNR85561.1 DUF4397 domain-containing protein [Pedobacter riviphilus]
MKIYNNLSKSIILLTCLCSSIGLSSCKKDNPDEVVKGQAKVKMVNASQANENQDVYLDNEKLTSVALAFGETSDYVRIPSGNRSISYTGTNNTTTDTSFNFTPSITYTTFLVTNKKGEMEIVSYEDNLSNTEVGKAKIKLINLTPNFATGINVMVEGGTQFVNGLAFKEASTYFTVDTGFNLRYTVVGSGNVKTIQSTALEAGKIYTIWFSGTTVATLGAHIITDN